MTVDVYNENLTDVFDRDMSVVEGDTWDDVLASFAETWCFEDGARYVLVARDNALDPVRILRARVTVEPA